MSEEAYPEDIEIKRTNFKTDQQEEAAEVIEAEWPIGLDTLAEEEGHVEMFYSQVLDRFLGPVDADMTFSEIESEYGSVEQWADDDAGAEEDDVEDIEPGVGTGGTDPGDAATAGAGDAATSDSGGDEAPAVAASPPPAEDLDLDAATGGSDVDERRREWFAAGFREGVEFALRNPDLFGRE